MSSSNLITLNNTEYYFAAIAASGEIYGNANSGADFKPTNLNAAAIDFSAFGGITLVDNLFQPFTSVSFSLNTKNNGIENLPSFLFKASNKNRYTFSLARKDYHKSPAVNMDKLSSEQRSATLFFDGVITAAGNIGSSKGSFSVQQFDVSDMVECLLREKKIAQILPAVDITKTVGGNIIDILRLVVSNSMIDEESFNNCTESFKQTFIYPVEFTAYDALMFLMPFCLGKVKGIDTQLILEFDKIKNQYCLISPMQDLVNFNLSERFVLNEQSGDDSERSKILSNNRSIYARGNEILSYNFTEPNFDKSNSNYVNTKVISMSNPLMIGDMGLVNIIDEIETFSSNIFTNLQNKYINGVKLNVALDQSKVGADLAENYKVLKGPYEKDKLIRIAKTQLYNLFMFENMSLSITVPGQIYRIPGIFIEIVKDIQGGSFDKKLLGHWYITEVKHIIDSKGIYMNEIICNKPFISN